MTLEKILKYVERRLQLAQTQAQIRYDGYSLWDEGYQMGKIATLEDILEKMNEGEE